MGRVPVPKTGRVSARDRFDTGSRQSCHARMALKYLWAGSPYRRPVRASVSCRSWTGRMAVRRTRMPLRFLWAGSPCQSADRCPLRHAVMPLRYLWKGSPCRRPTGIEERDRFEVAWNMLRHATLPLKYLWAGFPCQSADRALFATRGYLRTTCSRGCRA